MTPGWQDPTLPAADRVELLLEQMTLEEKVAQLGSRWIGGGLPDTDADDDADHNVAPMQDVFAAGGTLSLEAASRYGLGHLTRIFGSAPVTAADGAAELVRQQQVVIDASRLGIPALVHEECLTGFTTYGATVYPAAIAWGATFDPGLVERMAASIGRDMAAVGVHQGLSPVLDVVRDYRWGRVEETMGEDPYLVSVLGAAYVRGLQSAGVIATLKHFAGYSAARAGRNHGPVSMGRRELMEVILPPFETAVTQAGAGSVMNSYSDVDGVPAARTPGCSPTCCGRRGALPAASSPTTGRCRSWPRCTAWPRTSTMPAPGPSPPASTSSCRTPSASAPAWWSGCGGASCRRPWWTGPPGGSSPRSCSSGCSTRTGHRRARWPVPPPPTSTRPPTAPWPGRWPSGRSSCSRPGRRCRCWATGARGSAGWPSSGPAPRTRGVHGLLRLSHPCAAAPPGAGAGARGPDRGRRPAGRAARGRDRPRAGLPGAGRGPVRLRGGARRGPRGRPLRGPGRRPRRPLRARHVRRRLRRRGPPAAGRAGGARWTSCSQTGTPVVVVVVSGRPYALGDVHGRAAGLVQAFLPGEEGGPAIAGVLSGRVQPSGSCRCRSRSVPAGSPARTSSRRSAPGERRDQHARPDPAVTRSATARSYTTFEVDGLRISDAGCPPTASSPSRSGSATPAGRAATRSSSSTCATSSPRSPAR